MSKSLSAQIDPVQFLSYVASFGFSNSEMDRIGQHLQRSVNAHDFCRNTAIDFPCDAAEYLSMALAHSTRKEK